MKRVPIAAAALMGAVAILSLPASAQVKVGEEGNGWSKCEELYLERYPAAFEKFGGEAVGRNLVDDGALRPDGSVEEITDARACTEAETIGLMLNPPPPPEPEPTYTEAEYTEETYTEPTYSAPATSSSGGCPSYMAGEATSPDAVNPTSGAAGCWQVIPSTAAAMGDACSDVNSYGCLEAICAAQGNGAWVAADPC